MQVHEIELGPDEKYGHTFGYGTYYVDASYKIKSPSDILDRAYRAGWSNGCPIVRKLTGPESPYDPEWMLRRYSEVNEMFLELVSVAKTINPAVYDMLMTPRIRLFGEDENLTFERVSVPKSHQWRIAPLTAIEGYAAPRALLEIPDRREVVMNGALRWSGGNPGRFLAYLSELLVKSADVAPERVLQHVYPKGVLKEEQCKTSFLKVAQSLERYAPTVWKALDNLPASQREELDIAPVPYLG